MYACRKIGAGYTIAKSTEFRGVSYLEKDTTSIRVTKTVAAVFYEAGLNVNKGDMVGGSMWVYNRNIPELRDRIAIIKEKAKVVESAVIMALMQFMNICINKGYDIRFY